MCCWHLRSRHAVSIFHVGAAVTQTPARGRHEKPPTTTHTRAQKPTPCAQLRAKKNSSPDKHSGHTLMQREPALNTCSWNKVMRPEKAGAAACEKWGRRRAAEQHLDTGAARYAAEPVVTGPLHPSPRPQRHPQTQHRFLIDSAGEYILSAQYRLFLNCECMAICRVFVPCYDNCVEMRAGSQRSRVTRPTRHVQHMALRMCSCIPLAIVLIFSPSAIIRMRRDAVLPFSVQTDSLCAGSVCFGSRRDAKSMVNPPCGTVASKSAVYSLWITRSMARVVFHKEYVIRMLHCQKGKS